MKTHPEMQSGLPGDSRQIVVVTGGSSGIGKQVAADLLRRGDVVGILAQDEARLFETEKELRAISPDVFAVVCDVTNQAQVQAAFERFLERFGRIDVLVNNAGWATYRTFEETDLAELLTIIDVNLLGVVRTIKAVLPSMIARRAGHIVNIASVAGAFVITPNAVYGAAKHGVVSLSEALGYELHRFGISLAVVYPGRVETSFFDHETFRRRTPRKETTLTVSLEEVSAGVVRAIDRKASAVFVPKYWAVFAWLFRVFPWFVRPLYAKLIHSRIESLYRKDAKAGPADASP